MAGMESLTEPLLDKIFRLLEPKDCFTASCVQQSWKELAGNDSIWLERCNKMWSVTERKDHQRNDMPTFMAAYFSWEKELGKYGALAGRAHIAWHKIEQFLQQHHPTMLQTLRPGASEEDLSKLEETIGQPLPEAFQVLYRFHDGQIVEGLSLLHGLFGWLIFRDESGSHGQYMKCTAMLPIAEVDQAYSHGRENLVLFGGDTHCILFGSRHWAGARNICVDVKTGCVNIIQFLWYVEPAVNKPGGGGILEWFEAYADALDSGYLKLARQKGSGNIGISQIPRGPPEQVSMITRAVRVSASVNYLGVMIPGTCSFAYSIKFELLSEDEQRAAWPQSAGPFRPMPSVQLRSHYLSIHNAAGQVEHVVDGEGVNMRFPHLTFGEPSFEYQRSTGDLARPFEGFMEGYIKFVEGSLGQPTWPEFDVQCPKVKLCVPDYVF